MNTTISQWLESKKSILENIIVSAAEDFRTSRSIPNFQYDCKQTSAELYNLGRSKDLCYDRPTIGFTYSLWYHAKRVNTLLNYYTQMVFGATDDRLIEIFDLGAGTGAVQWAVGLAYAAMKELGHHPPKISVVNVDSSPFMLQYNQYYLWKHFLAKFPSAKDIATTYTIKPIFC